MGLETLLGIAIGGAVAAGSTAIAKSGGDKDSGPVKPPPLPQPPKPEDAAEKAEDLARRRKASQSRSVFTSPLGVAGEANVARKKLLGE